MICTNLLNTLYTLSKKSHYYYYYYYYYYAEPKRSPALKLLIYLFYVYVSCVISVFRREVDENCALLGYYTAGSGSFLPTYRDNLSVQSSGFKNSWNLRIGPIVCHETSVRNYHFLLRNNPEERSSLFYISSFKTTMFNKILWNYGSRQVFHVGQLFIRPHHLHRQDSDACMQQSFGHPNCMCGGVVLNTLESKPKR